MSFKHGFLNKTIQIITWRIHQIVDIIRFWFFNIFYICSRSDTRNKRFFSLGSKNVWFYLEHKSLIWPMMPQLKHNINYFSYIKFTYIVPSFILPIYIFGFRDLVTSMKILTLTRVAFL